MSQRKEKPALDRSSPPGRSVCLMSVDKHQSNNPDLRLNCDCQNDIKGRRLASNTNASCSKTFVKSCQ